MSLAIRQRYTLRKAMGFNTDCLDDDNFGEMIVPEEYYKHFTSWGQILKQCLILEMVPHLKIFQAD